MQRELIKILMINKSVKMCIILVIKNCKLEQGEVDKDQIEQ